MTALAPDDERDRRWVTFVAAAGVLMGALLLWLGRGRTFFYDEWDWLQERSTGGLHTLLERHNEHVSVVPVALYRLLFETVGFAHTWPYRLLVVLAHLGCAAALFALVRRRAGAAWAGVAALLLLGLGQAWDDLLWGFQVGFLGSVLGGLVAWWALDREDGRGDVIACIALLVASLSSSLGVPIALGVLAELALRRRWTALWVPGVGLVAYAAWYLGYGESSITGDGLLHAPQWALDAAAAAAGSLFGRGLDWGRPLLVAGGVALVWVIVRRGVSPRLAGLLVAGVAFWVLTGAARSVGAAAQPADTSRYLYLGAVLVLLVAAEGLRGRVLPRRAWGVAAVVVVIAVAQGMTKLSDGAASLRANSATVKAQLAAAEIVRPLLRVDFQPAPELAPQIRAGRLVNAIRASGSDPVGDPAAVLDDADAGDRAKADAVLAAMDLRLAPASSGAPNACQVVRTADGGAGAAVLQPAPGGIVVRAGAAPVQVALRRYAPGFPAAPFTEVPARAGLVVRLAQDASRRPWHMRLTSAATFRACGAG